jgi:OOP family OmpA-OmpF porin
MRTKLLTLIILAILLVIRFNPVNAQNSQMRWAADLGTNAIDDNGSRLGSLKGILIMPIPSNVQGGYYIGYGLSAAAAVSINEIVNGAVVNNEGVTNANSTNNLYVSFDAFMKYDLRKAYYQINRNVTEPNNDQKKVIWLDPYVLAGYGITHNAYYANTTIFTNDLGVGLNFWIKSFIGINLQAIGKFRMENGESNEIQFSAGVIYRFPNNYPLMSY